MQTGDAGEGGKGTKEEMVSNDSCRGAVMCSSSGLFLKSKVRGCDKFSCCRCFVLSGS